MIGFKTDPATVGAMTGSMSYTSSWESWGTVMDGEGNDVLTEDDSQGSITLDANFEDASVSSTREGSVVEVGEFEEVMTVLDIV